MNHKKIGIITLVCGILFLGLTTGLLWFLNTKLSSTAAD